MTSPMEKDSPLSPREGKLEEIHNRRYKTVRRTIYEDIDY